MTVTLRKRKKGDKISLYLDYYHQGKRQYEYLQIYLVPEPEKGKLSKEKKDENKKNRIGGTDKLYRIHIFAMVPAKCLKS